MPALYVLHADLEQVGDDVGEPDSVVLDALQVLAAQNRTEDVQEELQRELVQEVDLQHNLMQSMLIQITREGVNIFHFCFASFKVSNFT